ncbi:fumarylacetoacetase [Modestobacter sp. I12A-02628]|uniref:Fumarylacetoacetate hydrolase family protein n=1 Tax=Goekera deserti TaxID=2497753 RepID=A0A7K3WFM2_9ACTN|nr:fumarylacetoacetate hydrolase family protein [Goekera deserti]MPR00025.1 fumarylacetoacetase [Goekera deserti]NDI49804.1 fumarylacetoacetase [Goekera deserti]NEL55166.1 fumarylacetoacetate hydrolase family protein [Goekera deserti]
MSRSVLRTSDAWYVLTDAGAVRVDTSATTTRELLADRAAVDAAASSGGPAVPVDELALVSPVTAPCRVVAQMTNYESHIRDSNMDPATVPLTFFRKSSGSISGPHADVVRPAHVRFLDYEVEIGLVIGRDLPVGTDVTAGDLTDLVAGLVITNDVSARDVQLPKTQFYEAKSYPTFTPVGPVLLLLDAGEFARFGELRLRLWVNGSVRQDSTVADMVYQPLEALQALARFQQLQAGDLLLTGTPGGTALKAPARPIELIGALLPPHVKWKTFFRRQAANPDYLQDGDVMELAIGTPDGALDLGRQRTVVRWAR